MRRIGNRASVVGRNIRHPAFLMVILGVLAVGALGAVALKVTYSRAVDDAGSRAAGLTRLLEELTIRNVEAIDLVLQGIADTIRYARLPPHDAAFQEELEERLRYLPNVRALFVVGPDGFTAHDTDYPKTPRVSLADRPYFETHRSNASTGLHIATPLKSRLVDRWFVSLSRRIDRLDQTFGGIVVAALEPAFYEKFYTELNLGPADAVALLHADGTLIAHAPQVPGLIGRKLSDLKLFQEHLPKSRRGIYVSNRLFGGAPRIVSYRAVSGYPLVVGVALSRDAVLANWRDSAYVATFSFVLLTVLVLATTLNILDRRRERDETRRRVLTTQKLEMLGQMTGGIAHDFNNLVASIDSGLRLVDRNAGDPDKVRTYVAATREAVDRGARLVDAMRSFAKRQELGTTVADANALLRALEPMLRQAAGHGISVRLDLASDLSPCYVDRAHFDAMLLNLVINARDAMPGGGVIEIGTARWTEPDGSAGLKPGPYVRVRVRDTGTGMSDEVLDRLFEPFFTTKGDRGTGLGLAQVYGVMRQLAGDVRVSSKVGAGTTIELLFRAFQGDAREPPSCGVADGSGRVDSC